LNRVLLNTSRVQLRYLIKTPLRWLGYDIVKAHRTTPASARRQRLLEANQIDLVLDVGANVGDYARELRESGYRGRIISFEPRSSAFAKLTGVASTDPLWKTVHSALGSQETTTKINVSMNAYSSSLLNIMPSHLQAEPEAKYIATEEVQVQTLDSFLPKHLENAKRLYLKIDTQGFERNVIEGARSSLSKILGIQMELSLVPLYEGETLFPEMLQFMTGLGYRLKLVEPGIHEPATGELLQVDAVFFRA
jgi:FkbM family methyltransferase